MIRFGKITPVCCLAAASALALAQTPPAPPAPPAAPAPMAMPAPMPPTPMGRMKLDLEGLSGFDFAGIDADAIQQKIDDAMSKVDLDSINDKAARAVEKAMQQDFRFEKLQDFNFDLKMNAVELEQQARDMALDAQKFNNLFAFAQQAPKAPTAPTPPVPPMHQLNLGQNVRIYRGGSVDSLYDRGQRALENHTYDQALDNFTEVANRGGTRADAGLYWKAYTLNKLGRRDEATAALTELRTKYASSRWMDDAKALELEVKQSSGQKVSPESQSDDELKLLALNGLMQSDPDRAIPILERLLKGAQSPAIKKRAIYVLAANSSPKAQQLLEQIARGGANPDLQLQAIMYIGSASKQQNRNQLLFEIYSSTTDMDVKRAILNSLSSTRDKDRMIQIAKMEKNSEMRMDAIRRLGSNGDQADMWQFYQSETDPNLKAELLRMMSGNTERLIEIARTDKDAKLRRIAVQNLGGVKAANATDALVSIYGTEQDPQVKRSIVGALYSQKNVTALVQLGRKETDPDMKREIVRELVSMKSPEANQFLEEILK
jgi:hypothetical protein